jgi:uncharacterized protein (TIGR03663 family)
VNRWWTLGLLLAVAGGLTLRLPQLDRRPMHCDEAVHAVKFLELWQGEGYRYDPREYHGPTLCYATLPLVWLGGAVDSSQVNENSLRLVPVLFGVALICLLPLVGDGLGRKAVLSAAVLTAISPALVFYSRYYIHETLLVFFTFLFLAAGWRYTRRPALGWALTAGVALGLMHATKETFALNLLAMGVAAAVALARRARVESTSAGLQPCFRREHLEAALLAALAVSVVLFSSFFANAAGPLDSWRTYLAWFDRASGSSPHVHPWHFYVQRLGFYHVAKGPVWTEALLLVLALAGLAAAFGRRFPSGGEPRFVQFVGVYTVVLMVIYSAIPYKTPWCALGFLHGLLLLAGFGAVAVVDWCKAPWLKLAAALALAAAAGHLAFQSWRAAYPYREDYRNPYVYAHTSSDVLRLVRFVEGIAQVHPDRERMVVKVMSPGGDYWPLPWYLRGLKQVGWWSGLAPEPFAPVVIAGARLNAALDEKSNKKWLSAGYFKLRSRSFLELYVEFDLWRRYLELRGPPPDDE